MAALVKRPDGQVGGQRSFHSGVHSIKYGRTLRIYTGVRTCWELDTVDPLPSYSALFLLLLLLLPPSPAAFPPAAALARLLAGSRRRREPPGCAPPPQPCLPPGRPLRPPGPAPRLAPSDTEAQAARRGAAARVFVASLNP